VVQAKVELLPPELQDKVTAAAQDKRLTAGVEVVAALAQQEVQLLLLLAATEGPEMLVLFLERLLHMLVAAAAVAGKAIVHPVVEAQVVVGRVV
jgi:hypothetical protein